MNFNQEEKKTGTVSIAPPTAAAENETQRDLLDVAARERAPSPFTKNMFMLYGCILVATINSCIDGYDGSLMASINSYPQYRLYFHFDINKGTPATGIAYAIYTIGNLVGSLVAGPLSDLRGRRIGMLIASIIIILGAIIQATCHNIAGFMIGRFIIGFGISISVTAGPTYASEMAHPAYRGQMTSFCNTFWWLGAIIGSLIPWLTSRIQNSMAWRIPVWIQLGFSGTLILSVMFLPESPRWLLAQGRHEEALEIMVKYHGEGDVGSPIVQLEYREMMAEVSLTGSDKAWWDYRGFVNTRDGRYRLMLVVFMGFFSQWTGNGPVAYYYPQMLAQAGISDNHTQLLLQTFQNLVSFLGALVGAYYTDRWGRRPQLMVTTTIVVVIFAIVMALNAGNTYVKPNGEIAAKNLAKAKAEIALVFVFGFVFSCGWTPLQAGYPVEVLNFETRAKGMAIWNFCSNIASFYNTFVTGIAFTAAGWRYYFLFIFWDILEIIVIYFLFVETKWHTLEELGVVLRSPNPVVASRQKVTIGAAGQDWPTVGPPIASSRADDGLALSSRSSRGSSPHSKLMA